MERFENFYDDINMDDWAEYGDIEGEHKEFEIADASTADWAISKIADERKRKDYFVECANKEMEEKCERATSYLSGCLGKYLERDEVPKKKTATQESITLPAGKIIKKLPKTEYVSGPSIIQPIIQPSPASFAAANILPASYMPPHFMSLILIRSAARICITRSAS